MGSRATTASPIPPSYSWTPTPPTLPAHLSTSSCPRPARTARTTISTPSPTARTPAAFCWMPMHIACLIPMIRTTTASPMPSSASSSESAPAPPRSSPPALPPPWTTPGHRTRSPQATPTGWWMARTWCRSSWSSSAGRTSWASPGPRFSWPSSLPLSPFDAWPR